MLGGSQRLLMPGAVLIFEKTYFLGQFVIEQKYRSLHVFFPSHINVEVHFHDISPVDFNSLMT